jgi:hypothetical protein
MTHTQRAFSRFSHDGERLGQQFVERFTGFNAGAKFLRFQSQLRVGQFRVFVFKLIDRSNLLRQLFQKPIIAAAPSCEPRWGRC